jgi:hypothetical protein
MNCDVCSVEKIVGYEWPLGWKALVSRHGESNSKKPWKISAQTE